MPHLCALTHLDGPDLDGTNAYKKLHVLFAVRIAACRRQRCRAGSRGHAANTHTQTYTNTHADRPRNTHVSHAQTHSTRKSQTHARSLCTAHTAADDQGCSGNHVRMAEAAWPPTSSRRCQRNAQPNALSQRPTPPHTHLPACTQPRGWRRGGRGCPTCWRAETCLHR